MEKGPKITIIENEKNADNRPETPEMIEAVIKEILKNLEETENELDKAKGEIAEAQGELEETLNGEQSYDDEKKKLERKLILMKEIKFQEQLIDRLEISKERCERLLKQGQLMLEEKRKLN